MITDDHRRIAAATYHAIRRGDPVSDRDLAIAIDVFEPCAEALDALGERYHFAWRDLNDTVRWCKDVLKFRTEQRGGSAGVAASVEDPECQNQAG